MSGALGLVKGFLPESNTSTTTRSNSGTPGISKSSSATRKPDKKLEIVSTNSCHKSGDLAEGTLSTTDECGEALAEKLALENPVAIVKAVANLKPEVVIAALKKNKVSREEIGVLSDAYYDLADACHDLYMGMDKPV